MPVVPAIWVERKGGVGGVQKEREREKEVKTRVHVRVDYSVKVDYS